MNIILKLSCILIIVSCTPNPPRIIEKIVYINTPLYLPARPSLPTLKSTEVTCLSIDTKQKLIDRDRKRADYIDQLELIITSTKETKK